VITSSGAWAATAASRVPGVAHRGDRAEAEPAEQARQALPQQDPVLGENDPDHGCAHLPAGPHGSSTRSRVGPPAGLDSSSLPPVTATRSAIPVRPVPRPPPRFVCSPLHAVLNTSAVALGVLLVAGVLLTGPAWGAGAVSRAARALLVAAGPGRRPAARCGHPR